MIYGWALIHTVNCFACDRHEEENKKLHRAVSAEVQSFQKPEAYVVELNDEGTYTKESFRRLNSDTSDPEYEKLQALTQSLQDLDEDIKEFILIGEQAPYRDPLPFPDVLIVYNAQKSALKQVYAFEIRKQIANQGSRSLKKLPSSEVLIHLNNIIGLEVVNNIAIFRDKLRSLAWDSETKYKALFEEAKQEREKLHCFLARSYEDQTLELKTEKRTLKQQVSDLQTKHERLNEQLAKINQEQVQEREHLLSENKKLAEERKKLGEQLQQLTVQQEKERETLQAELKALQNKEKELKESSEQQLRQLQETNVRLINEKANLEDERTKAIERLNQLLTQQEQKNKSLVEELAKLKKENLRLSQEKEETAARNRRFKAQTYGDTAEVSLTPKTERFVRRNMTGLVVLDPISNK